MCKFIAEVSSNHFQDLQRCKEFIDVASDIGCWAVKFQLFRVRELFSKEALKAKPDLSCREKWELPLEFLPALADHCAKKSIKFSCTPFYLDAVSELEPYVDFYKVASYELLWLDLIRKCAETGKPLILSTGMADMDEIESAVKCATDAKCHSLSLLHCTSAYPTPIEEANLSAISTMREKFGLEIGWSDHTRSHAVVSRAVNHWDAEYVELHLDLDGKGEEYAPGHCWLPDEVRNLIDQLNAGRLADGSGIKTSGPSELCDRAWRADPTDGLRPLISTRLAIDS